MIPTHLVRRPVHEGFPRVSGDDPLTASTKKYADEFSPRERG